MAARKPLVIVNGEIQNLQAGDTLDANTTDGQVITLTPASDMIAGQLVYLSGADACTKAKADASGTSKLAALAVAAQSSGVAGTFMLAGVLVLTTAQWDAVMGTTGGLTAGTEYYLSAATSGLGTATATTTAGQYVVCVGYALSTTELMVKISRRILL